MKKGQIIEGVIDRVEFPNKGIILTEEGKNVIVKNGVQGQKVSASINKIRKGKCEGRLLEVLEKSPLELAEPGCKHFGECGGCTYQSLPYEEQLKMKSAQVEKLIADVLDPNNTEYEFLGIKPSPPLNECVLLLLILYKPACKTSSPSRSCNVAGYYRNKKNCGDK